MTTQGSCHEPGIQEVQNDGFLASFLHYPKKGLNPLEIENRLHLWTAGRENMVLVVASERRSRRYTPEALNHNPEARDPKPTSTP